MKILNLLIKMSSESSFENDLTDVNFIFIRFFILKEMRFDIYKILFFFNELIIFKYLSLFPSFSSFVHKSIVNHD